MEPGLKRQLRTAEAFASEMIAQNNDLVAMLWCVANEAPDKKLILTLEQMQKFDLKKCTVDVQKDAIGGGLIITAMQLTGLVDAKGEQI